MSTTGFKPGSLAAAIAVTAAAVFHLSSAAVAADPVADCRLVRNSDIRITACTEVIDSAGAGQEDKALAYRNRGNARADAGALDAAFADLSRSIELNPLDPSALASRGHVNLARSNVDGAIQDFAAAIRLAPNSASHLVNRGHAYLIKGLAQAAIADFDAAIALKPDYATALNHRGLAWRKAGDADRAIADYTQAIALNPVYAIAYMNRGYAYEGKGEIAKASEDFVKALLLDASLTGASDALKRLGVKGPLAGEADTLIARGKLLVEANCSRCHAVGAAGSSPNPRAPEFRRLQERHRLLSLREPLTRGITATHEEMPKFAVTVADVDAIVAYVNSLPKN